MNYKFYQTVRLPREVAEDRHSQKGVFIDRCITQILDLASEHGEDVFVHPKIVGSNKLAIFGNERNSLIAKELIRATIIEIEAGTFDRNAMLDFAEAKFEEYAKEQKALERTDKPISRRVDLTLAPHDMNRRQFTSYERLRDLFEGLNIQISSVENKPTCIELSSVDGKTLKTAFRMAQWAAKEISEGREITNNQMTQNFASQSFQTLGRERATHLLDMVVR